MSSGGLVVREEIRLDVGTMECVCCSDADALLWLWLLLARSRSLSLHDGRY